MDGVDAEKNLRSNECVGMALKAESSKSPSPLTSGDEGRLRIVSRDVTPDVAQVHAAASSSTDNLGKLTDLSVEKSPSPVKIGPISVEQCHLPPATPSSTNVDTCTEVKGQNSTQAPPQQPHFGQLRTPCLGQGAAAPQGNFESNGGPCLLASNLPATIQQPHPNLIIGSPTMSSFPCGIFAPQLGQQAIIVNSRGQPLTFFSATNSQSLVGPAHCQTDCTASSTPTQMSSGGSSTVFQSSAAGFGEGVSVSQPQQQLNTGGGAMQRQVPLLVTCRLTGPSAAVNFASNGGGSLNPYAQLAANPNSFAAFGGYHSGPVVLPGGQQMLFGTPQGLIAFTIASNSNFPNAAFSNFTSNLQPGSTADCQSFINTTGPKLPTVLPKQGSIFPMPQPSLVGRSMGTVGPRGFSLPSLNGQPAPSTSSGKGRGAAKEIDLVSPVKSLSLVKLELNEKLKREKKLKESTCSKGAVQLLEGSQPPPALLPTVQSSSLSFSAQPKPVPVQQALPATNTVQSVPQNSANNAKIHANAFKSPPISPTKPQSSSAPFPTVDQKPMKPTPKRRASASNHGPSKQQKRSEKKEKICGINQLPVIDFADANVAQEMHEMFLHQMEANCLSLVDNAQILTHFVDGFVIQESLEPFAIPPLIFDDLPLFLQTAAAAAASADWSAPPHLTPERSTPATSGASPATLSDDLPSEATTRRREPSSSSTVHTSGFASPPNLTDASSLLLFSPARQGSKRAACAACSRPLTPGASDLLTKGGAAYCSKTCYHSRKRSSRGSALKTSASSTRKRSKTKENFNHSSTQRSVSVPSVHSSSPRRSSETPSELPSTSNSFMSGIEEPSPMLFTDKNTADWTVDDVQNWLVTLGAATSQYTVVFRQQEIDGQALLLLQEDHLVRQMGLKLGPAVKICAALKNLRN